MAKKLLYIILKSTAISTIIGLVLLYSYIESQPAIYRMASDMSGIAYPLLIISQLSMAILSLPIFFNLKQKVRLHYGYSFLSFFGLHSINIILWLIKTPFQFLIELFPSIIFNIVYLGILLYHFIKFRKNAKNLFS